MQFDEEDVLDIPWLKSVGDEPIASPTPVEEAALLDEPQEAPATATHPLRCKEQAPKPEGTTGLGRQQWSPQICEDVHNHCQDSDCYHQSLNNILIGVPNPEGEAQPTLMPIGAMNFIFSETNIPET